MTLITDSDIQFLRQFSGFTLDCTIQNATRHNTHCPQLTASMNAQAKVTLTGVLDKARQVRDKLDFDLAQGICPAPFPHLWAAMEFVTNLDEDIKAIEEAL